jgi:hypothetical protein
MDTTRSLDRSSTWLSLVASTGTLICCALPILLVSAGLGAAVASATFHFPFLVTLSEHPALLFGGSAGLLAFTAWLIFLRPYQCPLDQVLAMKCQQARVWNHRIWWLSVGVWLIGFSAGFIMPTLRHLLP